MKKILGISLVSVLAVSPMMAHATDVTPIENVTGTALTTQAYVKGAYNDLAGHINTKQDKFTAGNAAVNTAVVQSGSVAETVNAAAVTAASDTALMSEKAVLTAVTQAVSASDGAMNTRVSALETTVGNSTSGLVKDLADEVSDRETADTALDGRLDTLEGAVTDAGSVLYIAKQAQTAAETTAAADATSKADAAEQNAKTYADGLDTAMDARVVVLEAANDALSGTYATKTGVDNAIEKAAYTTTLTASTVTGTVSVPTSASISVASSWTEDTPASAPVTLTNGTVSLVDGRVATSTFTTSADANYVTANQ